MSAPPSSYKTELRVRVASVTDLYARVIGVVAVGTPIEVRADFKSGNTYIDPDEVSVTIKRPGDDPVTYAFGTDSELVQLLDGDDQPLDGRYYVEVDLDVPGVWRWRVESTGDGAAAQEGQFVVPVSYFA